MGKVISIIIILVLVCLIYNYVTDVIQSTETYDSSSKETSTNLRVPVGETSTNLRVPVGETSTNLRVPVGESHQNLTIVTAGLGPEVKRLNDLETRLNYVQNAQIKNTNIIDKLYKKDVVDAQHINPGWFVQSFGVIETPNGLILGPEIEKFYGMNRICFRAQNNYPFFGDPNKPTYLAKDTDIGFRAMTVFKIPKTGYYNFTVLSDDAARLMYQKVNSDVVLDERNIRNIWSILIDQFQPHSETWGYSKTLYFQQSDLILLRLDYIQAKGNSACCIKYRYSPTDTETEKTETSTQVHQTKDYADFTISDIYCSLLWEKVPQMGVR